MIPYPKSWPVRYNATNTACDMLIGPCACGAWHTEDELSQEVMAELSACSVNGSIPASQADGTGSSPVRRSWVFLPPPFYEQFKEVFQDSPVLDRLDALIYYDGWGAMRANPEVTRCDAVECERYSTHLITDRRTGNIEAGLCWKHYDLFVKASREI